MQRVSSWLFAGVIAGLLGGCGPVDDGPLTAAQIVERNVEARGGLKAWQDVHSMVWVGHILSHNAPSPRMPFVLEMKRPDKMRFELRAKEQVSTRIFDGSRGWNLIPARGGVPKLRPYTKYELRYARDAEGIGGPLVDYRTKGVTVALDGTDKVGGRKAYRLLVTLPSGTTRRMWIDASNFLTLKYERKSRNAFGMTGTLSVYYANYRNFHGVKLPTTIASGTDKTSVRDEMQIDRVVVNPALPDWVFAKPMLPPQPPTVMVGNSAYPMAGRAPATPPKAPASTRQR